MKILKTVIDFLGLNKKNMLCPYCGSESHVSRWKEDNKTKFDRNCLSCNTHTHPYTSERQATVAWNEERIEHCYYDKKKQEHVIIFGVQHLKV